VNAWLTGQPRVATLLTRVHTRMFILREQRQRVSTALTALLSAADADAHEHHRRAA